MSWMPNFEPNLGLKSQCGPKNFSTTDTTWICYISLLSIIICKMNKFWWVAVEKMNLETKIIWRQVLIGPKFDPKNFFPPKDHNYLLDILFFCWNMQNQRNSMIQTWIIDQKPWIWANLRPICQNLGQKFLSEIWPSSLFLIYFWQASCKKSKKSSERFPRKTPDEPTTNKRTAVKL